MSTFTASQLSSNVKAVHTGVNVTASALSISATGTASSVLLLSQVPNGATLVDFILRFKGAGLSQTVKLGTSASPSGIMAITTLTITYSESGNVFADYGVAGQGWVRSPGGTRNGTANDFMPVRISLSDDRQPSKVWVQATLGHDICASAYFSWTLFYTMDGMRGHTTLR
jgi:hypothetical protein